MSCAVYISSKAPYGHIKGKRWAHGEAKVRLLCESYGEIKLTFLRPLIVFEKLFVSVLIDHVYISCTNTCKARDIVFDVKSVWYLVLKR